MVFSVFAALSLIWLKGGLQFTLCSMEQISTIPAADLWDWAHEQEQLSPTIVPDPCCLQLAQWQRASIFRRQVLWAQTQLWSCGSSGMRELIGPRVQLALSVFCKRKTSAFVKQFRMSRSSVALCIAMCACFRATQSTCLCVKRRSGKVTSRFFFLI